MARRGITVVGGPGTNTGGREQETWGNNAARRIYRRAAAITSLRPGLTEELTPSNRAKVADTPADHDSNQNAHTDDHSPHHAACGESRGGTDPWGGLGDRLVIRGWYVFRRDIAASLHIR